MVCRITRPDGWVVLNADDPLVAAVARRVRAQRRASSRSQGDDPAARAPPSRARRARVPRRDRLASSRPTASATTRIVEVGRGPDHDRRAGPPQRRQRARRGRRRARTGRDDRAGPRRPARLPPDRRPVARAAQPVPARRRGWSSSTSPTTRPGSRRVLDVAEGIAGGARRPGRAGHRDHRHGRRPARRHAARHRPDRRRAGAAGRDQGDAPLPARPDRRVGRRRARWRGQGRRAAADRRPGLRDRDRGAPGRAERARRAPVERCTPRAAESSS